MIDKVLFWVLMTGVVHAEPEPSSSEETTSPQKSPEANESTEPASPEKTTNEPAESTEATEGASESTQEVSTSARHQGRALPLQPLTMQSTRSRASARLWVRHRLACLLHRTT